MSQCNQCAAVYHPDDAGAHVCDPADIPTKGKPRRMAARGEVITTAPDNSEKRIVSDDDGNLSTESV